MCGKGMYRARPNNLSALCFFHSNKTAKRLEHAPAAIEVDKAPHIARFTGFPDERFLVECDREQKRPVPSGASESIKEQCAAGFLGGWFS